MFYSMSSILFNEIKHPHMPLIFVEVQANSIFGHNFDHLQCSQIYLVTQLSSLAECLEVVSQVNVAVALTVNGICLSWQLNGILWMETPPPEISKTTKGMTVKFLSYVGTHMEAQNKKNSEMSDLVCKLQAKIPKIPIF